MSYRYLGRSGLKVSRLALGTMMFGGPTDEPTSHEIIARAKARASTSSTPPTSTRRAAPRKSGRAIRHDRDDWVLATVRQPAGRGPQRPGHIPQVDHPGRGRQPAPAGHRLPRHPVLPPRRLQRPAGRGRARHRRPGPRRQAALFRRVEFPWMAHRRSGAPGRRRGHRPARGQPAAVQPGQPQRRGRAASGGGGLWRGRGVLQPAGAGRAHGQVRARPAAGRRHARGAPGQAAAGNGVASGIAAHRPPHPRLPRHQGHRSRAIPRWAGCSTTGW